VTVMVSQRHDYEVKEYRNGVRVTVMVSQSDGYCVEEYLPLPVERSRLCTGV
jgi:hypothetical protein